MWTNINGRWKKGRPNVNVGGTWKQSTAVWQNVKGTWHKMSFGFYGETKGGELKFIDFPSIQTYSIATHFKPTTKFIVPCTPNSDVKALECYLDYSNAPADTRIIISLDFYFTKELETSRDFLLEELNSDVDYTLKFSKLDDTKPYVLDLKPFNFAWKSGVEDSYLATQTNIVVLEGDLRFQLLESFYNYLRSNYRNNPEIKIILEAK